MPFENFLIFSSAVEHWSDAHSCPRSTTGLVGAMLDKRIDGFTARSLAPRSCYSISPKVHCSTRELLLYPANMASFVDCRWSFATISVEKA